jgi:putative transposase
VGAFDPSPHSDTPAERPTSYDFNLWSARKHVEKLRYMHRNPVKRGLVELPEQWKWSSFRAHRYGETRPLRVKFQEWALEIRRRPVESFAPVESPLIRKVRE